MPKITRCHKYGKQGYKFGKGLCHLYNEGTEDARVKALQKAVEDRDRAEKNKKFSMIGLIETLFN